ncbi:hypothetical protein SS50377_26209 [Spironucleus salmonicida]|uniref:Uncharacterized protein n=1 Tax=Spironucleus salmonicida TaxID=348837 RepID=V6LEZ6_9EUKA|nr:hypothetical protein SS50377_26209 [Spironucleus salmonicida]|eukprot:EST42843.1 Hypothetical protein SS50377_17529 [Spironucleus salmonicida]
MTKLTFFEQLRKQSNARKPRLRINTPLLPQPIVNVIPQILSNPCELETNISSLKVKLEQSYKDILQLQGRFNHMNYEYLKSFRLINDMTDRNGAQFGQIGRDLHEIVAQ